MLLANIIASIIRSIHCCPSATANFGNNIGRNGIPAPEPINVEENCPSQCDGRAYQLSPHFFAELTRFPPHGRYVFVGVYLFDYAKSVMT